MWDVKVGDKVVCISRMVKINRKFYSQEILPIVGNEYTVRDIEVDVPGCTPGVVYIFLEEIINPILPYITGPGEMSHRLDRFRPVRTTKINDLIEISKNPDKPVKGNSDWDRKVKKVKHKESI